MVQAGVLPAQDGQLMPQGDEFELQREAITKPEREKGAEGGQKREHADHVYFWFDYQSRKVRLDHQSKRLVLSPH